MSKVKQNSSKAFADLAKLIEAELAQLGGSRKDIFTNKCQNITDFVVDSCGITVNICELKDTPTWLGLHFVVTKRGKVVNKPYRLFEAVIKIVDEAYIQATRAERWVTLHGGPYPCNTAHQVWGILKTLLVIDG